jgi:hypothetical protein
MLPLSIDEQDRKLRAKCPQFRLVAHGGWMGVWEGTLTPICQTYRVRLVYFSRRYFDGWHLNNPYISIFVIDPPIGPDPRGTGEPPQHVYRLIRRNSRVFASMIPSRMTGARANISSIASFPGRSNGSSSMKNGSQVANGKVAVGTRRFLSHV